MRVGEMYSMRRTFGSIMNCTDREPRVKPSNDMPGIPQETIDRVLDSTNIVELIGSFLALKKIGQNFQGLCPFHDDKTPSLSVSPEKKIFRCFGCGASGNAITFLRRYKNLSFPEAVRFLADKARIPMDTQEDKKRDIFLFCLAKAQGEFTAQLRSGTYRSAVNYLTERGINEKIQEEFDLGYAGSVKDLISALKKSGIKDKEIPVGIGLLKEKEQGVTCPFIGRIIFPLTDPRATTVGFGGRAIDSSSHAKYINSPDSAIFNKRMVLFGLKQLRIPGDTVFVVEGYFDVLTLHQAGFKNTVGLLGTELSHEQMRVLENLARNAILIFDGDPGGQAALLRCLKVQHQNSTLKAVMLPEGDPDEIVREGRTAEFEALLENARPLGKAAIEIITRRKETQNIEQLTDEVTRLGTDIPDALEASLFAQEAAEALSLPSWVLQEKIQARREKKERIVERKRQLEKFLVNELLVNPSLIPTEKLESIKDLFDEGEEKKTLLTRILKHA
jgi:DNA primase